MGSFDSKRDTKPLITFALFAYKQESFIREAVEGAFSQTYEPLEIILSDDCSPDRTFAIMQEMVAAYQGPHKIFLNRTPGNMGLCGHYNQIIEKATGVYIVSAAGDDVSESNRVEVLWRGLLDTDPQLGCGHSNAQWIDPNGKVLGPFYHRIKRPCFDKNLLPSEYRPNSVGCVQIWRRDLHKIFGPFRENVIEDQVIAFRANFAGTIRYIDEPLVRYRRVVGSLSGPIGEMRYRERVEIILRKTQNWVCTYEQLLADLKTAQEKGFVDEILYRGLRAKILSKIARYMIASAALLLRKKTDGYMLGSSVMVSAQIMMKSLYAVYFGLRVDFGRLRHLIRRPWKGGL